MPTMAMSLDFMLFHLNFSFFLVMAGVMPGILEKESEARVQGPGKIWSISGAIGEFLI
jgi:hypothetical protein